MKNIFLILILATICLSCENWLRVPEYDKLKGEEVYQTEKGALEALNGLYLGLADNKLYGRNMSCLIPEVLSKGYKISLSEHKYYNLNNYLYSYDEPKKIFLETWAEIYRLIANCNEFLDNIDLYKANYTSKVYKQFRGEALGVRTLLHLDALRLFGHSDIEDTRESIPYYDIVTKNPSPIYDMKSIVEFLLEDINESIKCLIDDPINYSKYDDDDSDLYDYKRHYRCNLYAAYILKVRLLMLRGSAEDLKESYLISSSLLNNQDPTTGENNQFMSIFKPVSTSKIGNDYMYTNEIIFLLHNIRREEVHKELFSADLLANNILATDSTYIVELYESRDLRQNMWSWNADKELYLFLRYNGGYKQNETHTNEVQSLIRLGEVYLIAAETAPNDELKKQWLEELRLNRGFLYDNALGQDLNVLIEREYEREFYGEGQYFYYAKRNQLNKIRNGKEPSDNMTNHYKVPLPDSELDTRY